MIRKIIAIAFCLVFSLSNVVLGESNKVENSFHINPSSDNTYFRITNPLVKINTNNILKDNPSSELRSFITQYSKLFKTKNSSLKRISAKSYNDKYFLIFQQMYNDVPVMDADIRVTLHQDGTIGRMSTSFIEGIDIDTTPMISIDEANNFALDIYNISDNADNSIKVDNKGLMIHHDPDTKQSKLCWNVYINGLLQDKNVIANMILVDAVNGEIVKNQSQITNVSGTVSIKAYAGQWGIVPAPTMTEPSKYNKVTARGDNSVTDITDTSGDYSANPTNFDDVISYLMGPYAEVFEDKAHFAAKERTNYISSSTYSWTWDSIDHLHEYHIFYWMNQARDDFHSNITGFSTNHYYDNPMYGVGEHANDHSANSTAIESKINIGMLNKFPEVIYHEYAHNVSYENRGGQFDGPTQEATSDYFACTMFNDPVPNIYDIDHARDLDNSMYYEDYNDYGSPHEVSQILSGALWDLKNSMGASTTNALVYEVIGGLGSSNTFADFMDDMLLADDNDGNISNGTPHDSYIFTAFNNNHHILGDYLGGELSGDLTRSGSIYILENLTIPSGTTFTIGSNSTVYVAGGKHINVYGELDVASGAKFTKATGGSNWKGIDIESGGLLDVNGDITIEYAEYGLDIYGTGSISNGTNTITIQNGSIAGVGINSNSPSISNINFISSGTQYGSISIAGSTSNPTIQYCTSQGSKHALYIGYNSSATVDYFDMKNTHTSNPVYVGYPGTISINGTNNILKAAGVTNAIVNGSSGFVDADDNWWGVASPPSSYFAYPQAQYIDYSNPKSSLITSNIGIYKTAVQEKEPFELAQELEFSGSYDEALELYESALMDESNPWKKKMIITSMLRAVDHGDKDYDSLRDIVNSELETADSYYEATLDAILCEMLISEGKNEDAIAALYEKADKYKDTAIEVELLSRISIVHGKKLKDKQNALAVANRAKAINPGQDVLRAAFESAGQEYQPWKSTDKYKDETKLTKNSEKKLDKIISESIDISPSPNPFNPATTLSYSLANPGHVSLSVYSMTGQKVATLVDSYMSAGAHSALFDGRGLASGVYFYRFEAEGVQKTGRMTLIK
jgi:tetratricopeptide (TPR) repeat protein